MRRSVYGALSAVERLSMWIAQLSLVAIMLVTSIDALGRYAFGEPLTGGIELIQLYLMVILVFMAMPGTYTFGSQLTIDFLSKPLSKLPFRLSARLNAIFAFAAFAFIAYLTVPIAIEKFARNDTTFGVIQFPIYLSYVWVPIGCAIISVRLLLEVFDPASASDAGAE